MPNVAILQITKPKYHVWHVSHRMGNKFLNEFLYLHIDCPKSMKIIGLMSK